MTPDGPLRALSSRRPGQAAPDPIDAVTSYDVATRPVVYFSRAFSAAC